MMGRPCPHATHPRARWLQTSLCARSRPLTCQQPSRRHAAEIDDLAHEPVIGSGGGAECPAPQSFIAVTIRAISCTLSSMR